MSRGEAGSGRLARVIAMRGGTAAPEAPFVIEHREALIYMLCEAAELEHGIMCQYLFAAFSLKQSADEGGMSGAELAAVRRWRAQVSHVAVQEMLHLALVHNLLTAIGGPPHLVRPNLPAPAGHYPAGVQLALIPFGEQALRHFMFLERPEGMDLADADGLAAMGAAAPVLDERDIVPRGQDFATVGHLYRSIETGVAHLAAKYGEDWLFTGPPRAQATAGHFGWPELISVTGVASAQAAIDEILEQGEGPRGHWRNAHFGKFVEILDEYQQLRAANPAFDPVRPVLAANVRPHETLDVPLITDSLTAQVTDLFNVGYEILLQIFERFFAHTSESDSQLKVLSGATITLMQQVIRPLGDLIPTLPIGPEHPGRTAGPSFELFYSADYLLPHREAAWTLLAERLDVAAGLCEELCTGAGAAVGDQLDPVLDAIRQIAASLAAHLPASRPQASLAATGPVLSAAGVDALAARCASALSALPAAAEAGAVGAAAAALTAAVRSAGARAVRASGAGTDAAAAAGRLYDAALAATRLRTRLGTAGNCPPELAEATAALQDLALRVSPAAARPARLAELWDAQAGLRAGIQAASNGPYLATNIPALVDHLGTAARPAPQLALCRCGESAARPACDGACHSNGFSDAKDPRRVPDQRDTSHGQQVTVFDNRGICQHSGYCTSRLPAVFRTDAEPFVAPSGGRMDEIIRAVRDCPSGALSYSLGGHESRGHVDWDHAREAAIEVTADGPYRITGAIPLTGADGEPAARARGASAEHYALCRCGHSRNKPFCSGMHWYVNFRDPQPRADPTLFEWAGGLGPLTRTTRLLYEKHVPADAVLAPAFAMMGPGQPQRLAAWLAAALGGPELPAAAARATGQAAGQEPLAAVLPPGRPPLTEDQRARWATLLMKAADEAGLPSDPAFRAAWSSVIEWLSRSVAQAQPAAIPAGVPRWDWGPPGPPEPAADQAQEPEAVSLPGPDDQVSFDTHIKPLFRGSDRQSMSFALDLWSADDVRAHAEEILARLADGTMPCDGAWPAERIDVFRRWTQTGTRP
ncbi:MAG TPA: ferritin-like domain-containing protein [Streptosporangiaceae bacterium]|nr:ferritin-like domain-containing protein [Streptosporangiaceae bacterium]